MTAETHLPEVVSPEEWLAARKELLAKEKELTRRRDRVNADRRLPMVRIDKPYAFKGTDGTVGLLDLFEGRQQLIVYRFFLDPGMDIASYPEQGCPGCTMFADNLPNLTHLNARDTTMVFVSGGSQDAIRNYRARMGWDVPWYTTLDDFSADFDVSEYFGINVFLRDGDQIYRSYYTTARAAEELSSVWALLDITPFGRQEEWQDAPEGVPQDPTYSWARRHDEYTPEELAGGRAS
jgi:predicted dithiol-disulfide oxidoreductase (DUF899 family)